MFAISKIKYNKQSCNKFLNYKYKELKKKVNEQNELILNLKQNNDKLIKKNKDLSTRLLIKQRFINLTLYPRHKPIN